MEWAEETIVRLRTLWDEGLSTAEIGRRLGITPGAVRVRRYRAVRKLAELLGVTTVTGRRLAVYAEPSPDLWPASRTSRVEVDPM